VAEDNMVLLTEHIGKLEVDRAATKDNYTGVKEELRSHAIA
jgi:hypothetical protein